MTTPTESTLVPSLLAVPPKRQAGLWGDALRRLARNRMAVLSLFVIIFLVVVAVFAPVVAPYDYEQQSYTEMFQPPGWSHWMGTDQLGRDTLSRMIMGARISMAVGLIVQVIVLVVGLPIGLIAGYRGKRTDNLLMRFTDIIYAFPDLLFILIIVSAWGRGVDKIFIAIGVVVWTDMARLVRGQVLSLKEKEFVDAARTLGATGPRIVLRHLLPNTLSPIIVAVTLGIPRAIMAEAVLSFIGVGLTPPNTSWGTLIQDGYNQIFAAKHLVVFPAIAIAVTMLSFTFLGDGLRDALDPRMKR